MEKLDARSAKTMNEIPGAVGKESTPMLNKFQEVVRNPRKVLDFMVRKVSFKAFDHTNFRRFIVLSRSRTGTKLLISYLNSHPNVSAEYEKLKMLNGRKSRDLLSEIFSRQPLYIRARGFKIFYYHPLDDETREIWDLLINMQGLHVIHLKRHNILRTIISRKIAENQNRWILTGEDVVDEDQNKSIELEKVELKNLFLQTMQWESKGDFMFRHHPILDVYYEDFLDNLELTMSKIYHFLGLGYVPPVTKLVKQNPETLRKLVKNYDQLKAAFRGSEWQMFFEE